MGLVFGPDPVPGVPGSIAQVQCCMLELAMCQPHATPLTHMDSRLDNTGLDRDNSVLSKGLD